LGTYGKKDTLHNHIKVVIMNITEALLFLKKAKTLCRALELHE